MSLSKRSVVVFLCLLVLAAIYLMRSHRENKDSVQEKLKHGDALEEVGRKAPVVDNRIVDNRKKNDVKPLVLPPKDSRPWGKRDYEILNTKTGILGIKNGSKTLYAFHSDLSAKTCSEDSHQHCLLFPNGQEVVVNETLTPRLPPKLWSSASLPHSPLFTRSLGAKATR